MVVNALGPFDTGSVGLMSLTGVINDIGVNVLGDRFDVGSVGLMTIFARGRVTEGCLLCFLVWIGGLPCSLVDIFSFGSND